MTTTPVPARRGRRSQDGGLVTERLHGLMDDMQGENLPGHLKEAVGTLAEVIKRKTDEYRPQRRDHTAQPRA
ncbi:hypothetical protein [Peteryoungia ipomoeae]|uniref:Uncharacterized protein n=1 Tax=Peteryoungia ipomoeae TaxID=1210932 RepID=A0A4S8P195_9HYPH|nr:hypothetical protein [Peteryoungia ipomoeae]THV22442.1 hypothetical protein FAA97_14280 [Peteryoungia ipomoeae]